MSRSIKFFRLLNAVFLFAFLIFVNACNNNSSYINDLLAERQKNDNYYKYDKESPIPESIRDKFQGLNYFEPDESFKVIADFDIYDNPDTVEFFTSKPDITKKYLRYAKLSFNLSGTKCSIDAFLSLKEGAAKYIFIPFSDKTNGISSYSAGRYLDIMGIPKTNQVTLDFNTAYAPYCAYSDNYSCPVVPLSNHIDLEIKAGEKIFSVNK
jgi:uncharacterized protein (DUF1684 family)